MVFSQEVKPTVRFKCKKLCSIDMRETKKAILILEDGSKYEGKSFGYETSCAGEVVFNTAMTGYPESLTDPSYSGQILVTTYPLIGNYGVPSTELDEMGLPKNVESEKIHCAAIVCQEYSWDPSHWESERTLHDWLMDEKIPGIYGIDTRALTKKLRESGSMLGKIVIEGCDDVEFYDPNKDNLIDRTSCKEVKEYGEGKTVVLVDCGVKVNIIRCLLKRGVKVVRVPWDYDFTAIEYDGLFISNGPGNPDFAEITVGNIKKAIEIGKPICGICMGNQLLSKAAGASVYKLKYGHRSHNQPVQQVGTTRCFITSQNHGFAVNDSTIGADWEPYFVNMNDGTNEGIRHKTKPFFSAQFHPEACSGPTDTEFIFDEFVKLL